MDYTDHPRPLSDLVWAGERDSDGAPCRIMTRYVCQECDYSWTELWSCACDAECPECDNTCSGDEWWEVDENENRVQEDQ